MARSPSSPIILPCPAKRVSAFSVVDGSVYRPPPGSSVPLRQTGASTTRPSRHKWTFTFCLHPAKIAKGCVFFLLNPSAVFTQATSSHAEARSPRFVRVRPASSRNPIPVDSRRFLSTRLWGGSAQPRRAGSEKGVNKKCKVHLCREGRVVDAPVWRRGALDTGGGRQIRQPLKTRKPASRGTEG